MRQLALLESGCMVYGDGQLPKVFQRKLTVEETREAALLKKTEKLISYFRHGIGKFCSISIPDYTVDPGGKALLGLRLQGFMKIVADQAAEKWGKKDELQALDIRRILENYLGKDALAAANSEGNKYLLLFENGMLSFKPRVKIISDWSDEKLIGEGIFGIVVKPYIKRILEDTAPGATSDKSVNKYLGHTLMDIARYLARNTAELCHKKKIYEIEHEHVFRTVSDLFPEQLRQHALLKGSNDVNDFIGGYLTYVREPEEPPKKQEKKIKKVKPTQSSRRRQTKRKRSKSKTSRSRSKTPDRKRQKLRRKSQTLRPPSFKLNFSHTINDAILENFDTEEVIMAKNTSRHISKILNDVFDSIASASLEKATQSGNFGLEEVIQAIKEIVPTAIADLGLTHGLNVVNSNNGENFGPPADSKK